MRRFQGIALLALFAVGFGFNIDVKSAVVHRHTADTYFGYSIDIYQDATQSLLLVGAPKAQTTQPSITEGGAVFRCMVDRPQCSEIFFDRDGSKSRLNGSTQVPIEDKSNQWFGATVVTSKRGDSVLACAPHYKYFFSELNLIEPVGTCYYARDGFRKIEEFAPCRQEPADPYDLQAKRHNHHRLGYGMCGFSAAIPEPKNDLLYIGAPGAWFWQGALFVQNINEKEKRPNTHKSPEEADNSMLGYSTATGDFNGDGVDDSAVGVPRGDNLLGLVALYDHKLRNLVNLTNEGGQRGAFFGASVAVTDVDGDGFDDIIVGVPFYTNYVRELSQESKPKYDIGQVKVFFQGADHKFGKSKTVNGHTEWSRFGYSVAAAGDLNGDGYNDFIVGAPYDGQDGRGAVYVYHGAKDGIRTEYTQKIEAHEVDVDLKTFGFSLAGGKDVDGNEYPDVAVGAWQSNKAVMFRTKPVVTVTGSVRPNKATIDLDNKNCATEEFGRMACEKVRFCVKYEGKGAPSTLNLDLKVQLDAKKRIAPRAFFLQKDFRNRDNIRLPLISAHPPDTLLHRVTLNKGTELCETHDFYVPDTIRDKLTPITITVNYTYEESSNGLTQSGGLEPALDSTVPQALTTQVDIQRNCGSDNVCVPDLQLTAKANKETFMVGTIDDTLMLDVTVKNLLEDAYEAQFFITIPQGFEYSGIENKGKLPVSCSPPVSDPGKGEDYIFTCDIGNPLIRESIVNFHFLLTARSVDPSFDAVIIKMHVNSTNKEDGTTLRNNEVELSIPLDTKAQLSLIGSSEPEQLDYSVRNRSSVESLSFDSEIGPLVSHLYQVTNRGPSVLRGATLDIFWPSFTDGGGHLLYLIDDPYILRNKNKTTCRVKQNQNVNPDSLTIGKEHVPNVLSQSPFKRLRRSAQDELDRGAKPLTTSDQTRSEFKSAVREVKAAGAVIEYTGGSRASINCENAHCTQIECVIKELMVDDYVLVEVFARLWVNTLIDKAYSEADISSLAIAKVSSDPNAPESFNSPTQMATVTTFVNPTDREGGDRRSVPWWMWLLAILAGIAILLLLILCLWKCGFFKRNRPHAEQATLSKGGADEATTEHFAYSGGNTGYASPSVYSAERHGERL